jgi:undecaprenyl-diphosphatase
MTDKKNAKKYFIFGAISFVLFAVLTVLVKTVDVRAVGPMGSEIGLSEINTYFRDLIGVNMKLYDMTELLGYLAIAVAVYFAGFGVGQLAKRKSIKAVDPDIIVLGGFFAVVICAYVFFEIVVINYRPIITEGKLEASFPSSHTMLSFCVFGGAIHQLLNRISNKALRVVSVSVCAVLIAATVVGRLLSGVHWFTDIIAGAALSVSLLLFYIGACKAFVKK